MLLALIKAVDQLLDLPAKVKEMRKDMANNNEQLRDLSGKVDDLVGDVRASLDILKAKSGQLDAEGQAELDSLTSKVEAFDAEVGDADGSDATPTEPTV